MTHLRQGLIGLAHRLLAKNVLLLAAIALSLPAHSSPVDPAKPDCATLLSGLSLEELNDDFVKANGVAVTGDFIYPVDMVLHGLGLDINPLEQLKGKAILTVAEGVSGFLPFLLEHGINARGLDLWYGATDKLPLNYSGYLMRDYVLRYSDYLISGDARNIPLQNSSMDLVVSHMLMNNIDHDMQREVVREALRVTALGGEIRFFGFDDFDMEIMASYLQDFGEVISFRFEKKEWPLMFRGNILKNALNLLTIKKLSGTD